MQTFILIMLGGVTLTIGDIIAKKYVLTKKWKLYFFVLSFYFIGANFLFLSYFFEDIAVASMLLEITNITILTLVGALYYHERISRTELFGIITGLAAIILLEA